MEIISLNNLSSAEVKAKLLYIINNIIEQNTWTQAHAAEKLGIDQPKVSQIKNGKIDGFSLERLLGFLRKLNHDITITMIEGQTQKVKTEKIEHEVESQ